MDDSGTGEFDRIVEIDGQAVGIRQVGPADRDRLAEGYAHLNERSRYRRFLSAAPALTSAQLTHLAGTDDDDHVAIGAGLVATHTAIAVARYLRTAEDPVTAEIAITVADAWQGKGLGSILLDDLAAYARVHGVRRFNALILAENAPMLHLMRAMGPVVSEASGAGTVDVVVDLGAGG